VVLKYRLGEFVFVEHLYCWKFYLLASDETVHFWPNKSDTASVGFLCGGMVFRWVFLLLCRWNNNASGPQTGYVLQKSLFSEFSWGTVIQKIPNGTI
jgi:hypothetical protein